MNEVFIATGTVTYAMRAKELLRRNGIRAVTHRRSLGSEYGCGYGVSVPEPESERAMRILRNNGVRVLGTPDRS